MHKHLGALGIDEAALAELSRMDLTFELVVPIVSAMDSGLIMAATGMGFHSVPTSTFFERRVRWFSGELNTREPNSASIQMPRVSV
jgi:hypothetical protein